MAFWYTFRCFFPQLILPSTRDLPARHWEYSAQQQVSQQRTALHQRQITGEEGVVQHRRKSLTVKKEISIIIN